MEEIVNFDKQGRIYLSKKLKEYLQFKTLVARAHNGGVYLSPIEEDPLDALSRLGKGKLKSKSVEQLKREARAEIEANAVKKIRRH